MSDREPETVSFGWRKLRPDWYAAKIVGGFLFGYGAGIYGAVSADPIMQLLGPAWLLFMLYVTLFAFWPWFATPDPVLVIGPDGLHDRRLHRQPLPWSMISRVERVGGGIAMYLHLAQGRPGRRLDWLFPWSMVRRGEVSEFPVTLATVDMQGRDIVSICHGWIARHAAETRARALARLRQGGMDVGSREFAELFRPMVFSHPTMEKSGSADVHLVFGGHGKEVHAFTSDELHDAAWPEFYPAHARLPELLDLATGHGADAILIDPGSSHSMEIPGASFAALRERLRGQE